MLRDISQTRVFFGRKPLWQRTGSGYVGHSPRNPIQSSRFELCVLTLFLLLLISPSWCYSADLVIVRPLRGSFKEQQELEVAAHFYGLNLKVVMAGADSGDPTLSRAVTQKETLAVAIEANALPLVSEKAILRAEGRRPGGTVPILILGVTPETDATLLRAWSGGAAVGCRRLAAPLQLHYAIGRVVGLTGQLTGLEIPYPSNNTFYFALAEHSEALEIAKVGDNHQAVPVFIEATLNRQRVFLASTMARANESVAEANEKSVVSAFAEIAPAMMFIKYCAGERGWHALHHYANLTIDDPSLREPYGFLDYKRVLAEMEKHDFHSTIAFIPWNYDRSEPDVVSLIRNHPERFSISIHGDNHDHKEFADYGSKPLDVQVAALRQSLARMDRFQALTGIPYDKVMIFPHSIGPEKTLEALKIYNFLATVNSQNVPTDAVRPLGLVFAMRSATLSFGGLPSITRYSVAAPTPNYLIAINAFLDNPLLFYCHHELFESGMAAFDDVADRVNSLEPDTRWRGLGDIVRHLYLVKLRDDFNFDVLALSANINLENISGRDSVFYVSKMEGDHPAIASVTVDGQAYPFQLHGDHLDFNLPIPAGQARSVTIQYENHLSLPPVDVEKRSVRVYFLRMASDFRDNVLYRSATGRALIHVFYDREPRSSRVLEWTALALMPFCICVCWGVRILISKRSRD